VLSVRIVPLVHGNTVLGERLVDLLALLAPGLANSRETLVASGCCWIDLGLSFKAMYVHSMWSTK
jgi:hypothetical protein